MPYRLHELRIRFNVQYVNDWRKFQAKETESSSDKEEEQEEGETPLITGKAPISEKGIFSQSSKSALVTSLITHFMNHFMSNEKNTSRLIFSLVKISVFN